MNLSPTTSPNGSLCSTPQDGENTTDCIYNITSWPPSLDSYPDLKHFIARFSMYYLPSLVCFGTVSNTLAIIVFMGSSLRKLGANIYLTALAVADTGYLLSLFIVWLEAVNWPIFHTDGWCQVVVFLSYTCSFLSAWFVVAVTVERLIAIRLPLRRFDMCSPRRARIVVSSLSAGTVLFFSCTIWTTGIRPVNEHKYRDVLVCTPYNEYNSLHTALTIFDTITTLVIPFALLVVLNIIIAITIRRFYKDYRRMSCGHRREPATTVTEAVSLRKVAPRNSRSSAPLASSSSNSWRSSRDSQAQSSFPTQTSVYPKAQVQVTKMLLWVTTIYLVVSLPSYIMRLRLFLRSFLGLGGGQSRRQEHLEMIIHELCQLIYYTTFVINFVLYNLCNPKFRQASKGISRRSYRCLVSKISWVISQSRKLRWRLQTGRHSPLNSDGIMEPNLKATPDIGLPGI